MERQFPKNVKQIGNVSDEPKIYVEDYVDTYLGQLKENVGQGPVGAILVGEILTMEGQAVVYISGAIQMKHVEVEGTEIKIGEDVLAQAEEDRARYFPSCDTVGWCLACNGHPLGMIRETVRIHEKSFAKDHSIFIWKDALEDDEVYYAYKYGELMQMGGHYIYYERNPAMQGYMIGTRKKIGVTPSEMVEDRAAKDFRLAVREQMTDKKRHQSSKMAYAASVLLVLIVLVIGISAINNFDKMESVQSSLETLSQKVSGKTSQAKAETDVEEKDNSEMSAETQEKSNDQTDSKVEANADTQDTLSQAKNGESDESSDAAETSGDTVSADEGTDETSSDDVIYADDSQLTEEDFYTVQKGDTLDSISRAIYGDSTQVDALCKMNGLSDGNLIYVGQKLLLP